MKTALVLLLALTGFGFSKHAPVPSPSPSGATQVEVTIDPIPQASPWPEQLIEIEQVSGATDAEIAMIDAGVALANAKVKSNCYRQWVRAAKYTETEGLTQAQIDERIQTVPSKLKIEMYTGTWKANHVSKTVGYETDPYDGWVHMNRFFVKTSYAVADNLLHEDRGHGLGFHHYGAKGTSEPYGQNYAFEGCSQQMMQARGAKDYKPPGIRLEIRKVGKRK